MKNYRFKQRNPNRTFFEEEDKKALLLTLKKKSYRNGILSLFILWKICDNKPFDDFINCNDYRLISDNNEKIEIQWIENSPRGFYRIRIINSDTKKPPEKPFKIILSAYLFNNEMQYFSLPLNFRGKKQIK